jgi:CheY-like chemotaxis protein
VLVAPDGERALAVAEKHPGAIDLLLTDLVMPGISGKELAERIRAARPDTEVIYMSGYLDDDSLGADVTEGTVHFVPKPFARKGLLDKVIEVLSARRTGATVVASAR